MCTSKKVLIIVIGCLLSVACFADEIVVISWNVESGGADPGVVTGQPWMELTSGDSVK